MTFADDILVVAEHELVALTDVLKRIGLEGHVGRVAHGHLVERTAFRPLQVVGVHIVPEDLRELGAIVGGGPGYQFDARVWRVEEGNGRRRLEG